MTRPCSIWRASFRSIAPYRSLRQTRWASHSRAFSLFCALGIFPYQRRKKLFVGSVIQDSGNQRHSAIFPLSSTSHLNSTVYFAICQMRSFDCEPNSIPCDCPRSKFSVIRQRCTVCERPKILPRTSAWVQIVGRLHSLPLGIHNWLTVLKNPLILTSGPKTLVVELCNSSEPPIPDIAADISTPPLPPKSFGAM